MSSESHVAFKVTSKEIARMGGFLVFPAYAGEGFRCEATVDVLTKVFCCEMVCLKLVYMIYGFV